jgi:hypothetical protein
MGKKLCKVNIRFRVPKEKACHIFRAKEELALAGITFDTGGSNDGEFLEYDWEFDWSLKGGVEVRFKKYKDMQQADRSEEKYIEESGQGKAK